MNSDGTATSPSVGVVSNYLQRIPVGGLLVVAGTLVGLGALLLVRGIHLYIHFYSYASGIATHRLQQTLFWSIFGGIVLALGLFLLARSLSRYR